MDHSEPPPPPYNAVIAGQHYDNNTQHKKQDVNNSRQQKHHDGSGNHDEYDGNSCDKEIYNQDQLERAPPYKTGYDQKQQKPKKSHSPKTYNHNNQPNNTDDDGAIVTADPTVGVRFQSNPPSMSLNAVKGDYSIPAAPVPSDTPFLNGNLHPQNGHTHYLDSDHREPKWLANIDDPEYGTDWMCLSMINAFLCFVFFGLVGVILSYITRHMIRTGTITKALHCPFINWSSSIFTYTQMISVQYIETQDYFWSSFGVPFLR